MFGNLGKGRSIIMKKMAGPKQLVLTIVLKKTGNLLGGISITSLRSRNIVDNLET